MADAPGALHGQQDARQADLRVHALVAAALAVVNVLVDDPGVEGRGVHRLIGFNILRAADVTGGVAVKV